MCEKIKMDFTVVDGYIVDCGYGNEQSKDGDGENEKLRVWIKRTRKKAKERNKY